MLNLKAFSCAVITAVGSLQPSIAFSQVYKCVDVNGKITFSDQGCATNHSSAKVDTSRVNTQDSSQYQQRILDDRLERSQPKQKMRVTVVGDGRSNQQGRMQDKLCREALTKYKGAHGLTAAQLSAAASCYGSDNGREDYSPSSTPPPSHITNCDSAGCWDNQGQRYNKGAGPTHIRQDGKVCQYIGGQMQCH